MTKEKLETITEPPRLTCSEPDKQHLFHLKPSLAYPSCLLFQQHYHGLQAASQHDKVADIKQEQ